MSRPLSPWAERFSEILNDASRPAIFREEGKFPGLQSYTPPTPEYPAVRVSPKIRILNPYVKDLEHSGIAIDWPRKDPKYYNEADVGYFGEHTLIPHDGADIDRLLASEQYQKGMFSGARTWELASMNQHLWGSAEYRIFPGGHSPADNPEVFLEAYERVHFTIDESKWFEFLQKFHWYDLFDDPNRPTRPAVPKGAPWSVDVPSIWEILTPSIELVNRILRALINEQHNGLETLLFGRLVYWRNIASATNIAIPFNDALVLLSPQMELQVAAAENKVPYQNPLASVPEQFKSQAIMFHELMHSIISIRYKTEGAPRNAHEPFIDFDAVSEIGEAMEHRVFGGRYVILPTQGSVPLVTLLHLWPSPLANVGIKNPHHPAVQDGAQATFEIFPTLHISKLFSSEFWDNPFYPRKTDPRFWHTEMLSSTTRPYEKRDIEWRGFELDETYGYTWDFYDRAVVDAWKSRQMTWAAHRQGWFDRYARIWANTPWGAKLSRRRRLDLFNLCFQVKDEFLGYECPTALVMGRGEIPDWRDREEFFKMMPARLAINNAWVYFAIGLLMFAAMPIRRAEYSEGLPHTDGIRRLTFTQSAEGRRRREVDGWDAPQRVEIDEFTIGEIPIRKRAANVINNPFDRESDDAIGVDPVPTHQGYLDLVDDVLRHIVEERAVVSGPWYSEILRMSLSLRIQRGELINEYPETHETLWAKRWDFRAPKFDPDNEDWIQLKKEDTTWRHHAHTPSFDESPQPSRPPSIIMLDASASPSPPTQPGMTSAPPSVIMQDAPASPDPPTPPDPLTQPGMTGSPPSVIMQDAPASPNSPTQPGYAPSVTMESAPPSIIADSSLPSSSGSESDGDTPSSGPLEFDIDDFGSPGDDGDDDDDDDVDVSSSEPSELSQLSVYADVMEGLVFSNQVASSDNSENDDGIR
ncbi:hypothetical protein EKO27_g7816 [Xylaria grammica]|uniref:Uncharacterized protein n=1 Tax=Xylaria grammica TaxID=363999 RepID=A0A439CYS4_9PEZI|nr:hypothetical protein EKO27_g7816 [Xylaria grammica]